MIYIYVSVSLQNTMKKKNVVQRFKFIYFEMLKIKNIYEDKKKNV